MERTASSLRAVAALASICVLVACGDRRRPGGDEEMDAGSAATPCDRDGDGYRVRTDDCSPLHPDCDDQDPTIYPGAPDGPWAVEVLPDETEADDLYGLAVDAEGTTLLVTREGTTLVAWRRATAEGEWLRAELGTTSRRAPADMIVADDGTAHVAFVDGDGKLRLAVGGETWTTEVVDPDARLAPAAIALDPSGAPVIAYAHGETLRVGRREGTSWEHVAVDVARREAVLDVCVAVDGDGHYHVLYVHPEDGTRYATDAPVPYPRTRLQQGARSDAWCDLAFAPDGQLDLVFRADNSVHYGDDASGVPHAENTGADPGVDSTELGLLLDETGPHIAMAYQGYFPGHLYQIDGVWILERIDHSEDVGWQRDEIRFAKIAREPGGALVAAYGGRAALRLATRIGEDGIDQDCDGVAGRWTP